MSWIEVAFEIKSSDVEQGTQILEDLGALAVSCFDAKDEPLFEPPPESEPIIWQDSILVGLMDKDCSLPFIEKTLLKHFPTTSIRTKTLEDKNWVSLVQSQFQPMDFGKLCVYPSWSQIDKDPQKVYLKLDPGMAFGTGTHPTTKLCLDWLSSADLNEQTIVDYGCGSGILSIASALLGAKRVYAIDYDPKALESTTHNQENNEISKEVLTTHLPKDNALVEQGADIVVANILAGPLLELKDEFLRLLKPNGILVLSGLLETQLDLIKSHYEQDFAILEDKQSEDWCLLRAQKEMAFV